MSDSPPFVILPPFEPKLEIRKNRLLTYSHLFLLNVVITHLCLYLGDYMNSDCNYRILIWMIVNIVYVGILFFHAVYIIIPSDGARLRRNRYYNCFAYFLHLLNALMICVAIYFMTEKKCDIKPFHHFPVTNFILVFYPFAKIHQIGSDVYFDNLAMI